jgi:hypothetical protein
LPIGLGVVARVASKLSSHVPPSENPCNSSSLASWSSSVSHLPYLCGFCVTVRRASQRDRHIVVTLIVIEKMA